MLWSVSTVMRPSSPTEISIENTAAMSITSMTASVTLICRRWSLMNDFERDQIKKLRECGYSYGCIANELGLPKDTVKSHCRRHGLDGVAKVNSKGISRKEILLCKTCGIAVIQTPGRKAKKFCSDRCRMKWWNSHADQVNKKATYDMVCANCGCSFQVYGDSKRKYCCHECYVEGRFGKKKRPVQKIDECSKPRSESKSVMTRKPENNEIYYSLTMYWVKRMYDEGIITAADYNKMREMMIEKYHPVVGSLFYDKIKEV